MPTVYLYVIECPALSAVKVGITQNLERRFYALQQGIPATLDLIGYLHGSRDLERQIHFRLREAHVRGEWFNRWHPVVVKFLAEYKAHYIAKSLPKQRDRILTKAAMLEADAMLHYIPDPAVEEFVDSIYQWQPLTYSDMVKPTPKPVKPVQVRQPKGFRGFRKSLPLGVFDQPLATSEPLPVSDSES